MEATGSEAELPYDSQQTGWACGRGRNWRAGAARKRGRREESRAGQWCRELAIAVSCGRTARPREWPRHFCRRVDATFFHLPAAAFPNTMRACQPRRTVLPSRRITTGHFHPVTSGARGAGNATPGRRRNALLNHGRPDASLSGLWSRRFQRCDDMRALRRATGHGGVPFVFRDDFSRFEILRPLRGARGADGGRSQRREKIVSALPRGLAKRDARHGQSP